MITVRFVLDVSHRGHASGASGPVHQGRTPHGVPPLFIFHAESNIRCRFFLMELRRFRADHPEQFRRIAKLPARCHVGRADSNRARSTVGFIRNAHRDAFYRIRPGAESEEIRFTEAAREFCANRIDEPAVNLPTGSSLNRPSLGLAAVAGWDDSGGVAGPSWTFSRGDS